MRANDGKWSGLAIELMEEIGRELSRKISWTFVDTTEDIIKAVATGKVDAGIAAVTITAERETKVDFSHPYYDTGLSIAVANRRTSGLWDITCAMISPAFLKTVGTLGVLLFFIGSLVWLFERQRNSDQFHKEPIKGIGNGIWWAAVTMTTVGYGDKTPTTPLGRAVAVIWMFAALILTALFTAHLASSLTAHRIAGPVASVSDLPSARVGIVEKSSSSLFFEKQFIRSTTFPDVSSGLHALAENKIDAFVHDEPILRYHIEQDFHGVLDLLPHVFEPADYGIVLPSGSVLRETVNQELLNVLSSPRWSRIRQRYLGQDT